MCLRHCRTLGLWEWSCRLLEKSGRRSWPGVLIFKFPVGGSGGGPRNGELYKKDGEGSIMGKSRGERGEHLRTQAMCAHSYCLFQQQGTQSCKAQGRNGLSQSEGETMRPGGQKCAPRVVILGAVPHFQ